MASLSSQVANPFELTPRISPDQQPPPQSPVDSATLGGNPFDLQPRLAPTAPDRPLNESASPANPFELSTRPAEQVAAPSPATNVPVTTPKEENQSWLLPALIGLLALTATLYLFFRALYRKAYRAMFNDNLLSQLYRERSGGNLGGFILTYLLFLLSAALFINLLAIKTGYASITFPNYQFMWLLGIISTVFVAKHLALALIGYIFPIGKEASRYSFTIMIYAIVLGPLLALACLALAYAEPQLQPVLLYAVAGLVVVAYLIRSLRGLFIANRFLVGHGFHFLLYLCAIEIIPLLWIYKLVFQA
jgi:hypothetical protein